MPETGILHVYGQYGPHDEVIIVGDRRGLAHLRSAIERSLETNIKGEAEVMTNDGEHYEIHVTRLDCDWQDENWQSIQLPYTDQIYRGGK